MCLFLIWQSNCKPGFRGRDRLQGNIHKRFERDLKTDLNIKKGKITNRYWCIHRLRMYRVKGKAV